MRVVFGEGFSPPPLFLCHQTHTSNLHLKVYMISMGSAAQVWKKYSYLHDKSIAIAGNSAPISPVTPRDRRRLRIERRRLRIEWPPRDHRRRCPKRRRLRIERRRLRIERRLCGRYRRIEWRVFHDVSQCINSVSWCFTSVSWCFTSGSRCFTMYHNVLHVSWCLTFYDV